MLNWQVRFTRNQNHLVTLIRNQISGPIGNFIRLNTSHTWSGHVDCQYLVALCCCIFLTHLSISRVRFSEDPQDITGAQQVPNTKGWTTQEEIGLVGRLEANGHARGWDERSWCSRALHTVNARGSSTLRHQKFTNPLLGSSRNFWHTSIPVNIPTLVFARLFRWIWFRCTAGTKLIFKYVGNGTVHNGCANAASDCKRWCPSTTRRNVSRGQCEASTCSGPSGGSPRLNVALVAARIEDDRRKVISPPTFAAWNA